MARGSGELTMTRVSILTSGEARIGANRIGKMLTLSFRDDSNK
jgi:hypothetical protein